MKVEYAKRALSDVESIAKYYASTDDPNVGERIAARLREVVARLARLPESGRPVAERPGVRVAPLLRYPYNIYYSHAVGADSIRILHIRHSSRRPWPRD